MHPSLLKFPQNPERSITKIHPLAGINVGKPVIIEPAFFLIVIQNSINNVARHLSLTQFQTQLKAAMFPSGKQS